MESQEDSLSKKSEPGDAPATRTGQDHIHYQTPVMADIEDSRGRGIY